MYKTLWDILGYVMGWQTRIVNNTNPFHVLQYVFKSHSSLKFSFHKSPQSQNEQKQIMQVFVQLVLNVYEPITY